MGLTNDEIMRLDEIMHRIARRFARQFGRSRDEAEQCHAEGSCKILARLPAIEPKMRERYVAKYAHHEARRYFSKRLTRKEWPLDILQPVAQSRGQPADQDSRLELLHEGLPQLEPRLRDVVQYWLQAGGRHSAVKRWAEARGYSRATGYKWFSKAKRILKIYIQERS